MIMLMIYHIYSLIIISQNLIPYLKRSKTILQRSICWRAAQHALIQDRIGTQGLLDDPEEHQGAIEIVPGVLKEPLEPESPRVFKDFRGLEEAAAQPRDLNADLDQVDHPEDVILDEHLY